MFKMCDAGQLQPKKRWNAELLSLLVLGGFQDILARRGVLATREINDEIGGVHVWCLFHASSGWDILLRRYFPIHNNNKTNTMGPGWTAFPYARPPLHVHMSIQILATNAR